MRERGDFNCHHEPFMYDYYVNRKVREMPHFEIEKDRPQTYQDIRDMLLREADQCPVFFKDMSYYVVPHILDDMVFLKRLTHCFLIRDPISSILSYYKLDPEVTLEEIGLEAQWHHYSGVLDAGLNPIVIEAESIRNDPKPVMAGLWKAIGIPYEEKGFEWQKEKPDDWGQVSGWHGEVIGSGGIKAVEPGEINRKNSEFEELSRIRPHLQKYLVHHYPFYEKLQMNALRI